MTYTFKYLFSLVLNSLSLLEKNPQNISFCNAKEYTPLCRKYMIWILFTITLLSLQTYINVGTLKDFFIFCTNLFRFITHTGGTRFVVKVIKDVMF